MRLSHYRRMSYKGLPVIKHLVGRFSRISFWEIGNFNPRFSGFHSSSNKWTEKVIKEPQTDKRKENSVYKAPEYYEFNKDSFNELTKAMQQMRLPRPSSKVPIKSK